jgi:hypothetical protein
MNTRIPRELIVPATHRGLRELIVPATHRGLRYKDGALADVLEAGRCRLPRRLPFLRRPVVQIQLQALGENASARLYVGFDRPIGASSDGAE